MNCYDLNKRNIELNAKNKEHNKQSKNLLAGIGNNAKQALTPDGITNLIKELENRRFSHMFRRKYAKNGKTAEAEDGIEIMLKDSKNTIVFIQTYLMGDPSLWKINDNYNKALKGQKN